jgi:hypothetical protein
MEYYTADELDVEVAHLDGAQAGLADDGECLWKDLIERGLLGCACALGGVFAGGVDLAGGDGCGDALAELAGFRAQLVVGERLDRRLERVDLLDHGQQALDRPFVTCTKDLCE